MGIRVLKAFDFSSEWSGKTSFLSRSHIHLLLIVYDWKLNRNDKAAVLKPKTVSQRRLNCSAEWDEPCV